MSKLILHLEDGTTLDIPLDHERITIGRRAVERKPAGGADAEASV